MSAMFTEVADPWKDTPMEGERSISTSRSVLKRQGQRSVVPKPSRTASPPKTTATPRPRAHKGPQRTLLGSAAACLDDDDWEVPNLSASFAKRGCIGPRRLNID